MLIITGVGGLIVWYSMGYMKGEDEERRYFAYMALFVFSMLMLVMGGNLLLLLVGWGLVGLASYLLIGFYHDRPEAVAAAKKAFIMNAIGDAAMALALLPADREDRLARLLDRRSRPPRAASSPRARRTSSRSGCSAARSRSRPSSRSTPGCPTRWKGPTPVSALIHAATMVTAGVYLIVRTHPIFEAAPDVQHLAAIIGAVTLLVAGARRTRAVGHQARDRVFDDVADRLHVPRGRDRRVRLRHVPPDDARLLQGAALPRSRDRDPPARRRAGHPQDGRSRRGHAVHAASCS